jgi:hypothetical protein
MVAAADMAVDRTHSKVPSRTACMISMSVRRVASAFHDAAHDLKVSEGSPRHADPGVHATIAMKFAEYTNQKSRQPTRREWAAESGARG